MEQQTRATERGFMRTFFFYDEKNKTIKIYLRQLTDGSSEE